MSTKKKIEELENIRYYCDVYHNKYKVLKFLKKCMDEKAWKNKSPTEWRINAMDIVKKVSTLKKQIQDLEKTKIDLHHDLEIIEKLEIYKTQKENIIKILESLEYEMTCIRSKLEEIQINQAIWNENNSKMYELLDKIKKEKTLVKIFEKDGLPLTLLREKISQVEIKLNHMIQPFIKKKVRFESLNDKNSIDFGFLTENNQLCSFVSGMESFILDICLKFCLSYFYIRPKPNIFIIDEKVSVLDKSNLANIELLFNFLKSTSTNILLISHIEQIKDFVDKSIIITKTNGKSHVEFS